ncbi:hypothetical protein D9611_004163 [Ephemerocybe angulata]|uniref:Fruit-body specific protein a n=1 Tax=Ephemerocybe angulata TaxID=980116 RepID=A0A8H5BKS9_9AGAR|nr:hypothetical protein D9611_004163 [Tulosesus angulatus]
MKFSTLLTTAMAVGAISVAAAPAAVEVDPISIFGGVDMSAKNFYGAGPIKPWQPGAKPGWYYGNFPWLFPWLPCLHGPICTVLPWFPWIIQCPKPPPPPPPPHWPPWPTWPTWPPPPPHWPPPPNWPPAPPPPPGPPTPTDGYTNTFHNFTGATQAADYLTFGLVDTVADCKAMCNSIPECTFANTYYDVNGKDGSPQLTCSLYKLCHTSTDATNTGGQTQPNGSVNYIKSSDGWCKK